MVTKALFFRDFLAGVYLRGLKQPALYVPAFEACAWLTDFDDRQQYANKIARRLHKPH